MLALDAARDAAAAGDHPFNEQGLKSAGVRGENAVSRPTRSCLAFVPVAHFVPGRGRHRLSYVSLGFFFSLPPAILSSLSR